MIRPVHPFPARMAPELAIEGLRGLAPKSLVLDPMVGSGTVVRHAIEQGLRATGFDLDPLAVLITRVWTTPVDEAVLDDMTQRFRTILKDTPDDVLIPWIDGDEETSHFIDYWFGRPQQAELRRLAFALNRLRDETTNRRTRAALNVLEVALSRIIITKDRGASLARDVSHSRPHKVTDVSSFSVMTAFEISLNTVRRLLLSCPPPKHGARINPGDARDLLTVGGASVDAVVTSPPYLNAIDYMRGHRMSLVWLGHQLHELRRIRSEAIGAERALGHEAPRRVAAVRAALGDEELPPRYEAMVMRYCTDIYWMMSEISRVLKCCGRAILVVGNSCLKGVFIHNSSAVTRAASLVDLKIKSRIERQLPAQHRYLPLADHGALGKRMRTEAILSFVRM